LSGLEINEPSTTQISALTCYGFVNVNGASAQVKFVGATTIDTLTVNLGHVAFNNGARINYLGAMGGNLNFADISTVGTFSTVGTVIAGYGPVNAINATINGNTQIITALKISNHVEISGKQITLDGLLSIASSAVLRISGVQGFWGPTNPSRPGTLNIDGQLVVAHPNVTMNSLLFTGAGNLWILDASADFQNMNISVSQVGLNSSVSILKGESFRLAYGSLTGPKQGSTIALLVDAYSSSCQSPCSESNPAFPAQSYWAKVSSA